MAEDTKKLEELEAKLAEAQKSIEALTGKNRELLEEKRSTKSGAERQLLEAQDKIAELETQISKMGADHKKALDKATAEAKAAQDLAASKSQSLGKLIKDEGLTRELLAAGVKNPVHLKAASAMLRELVQVDEEKGEAFVLAKDAKTGAETRKALADFAKEWAQSDEGKAFISIPGSSGSGSGGGQAGGGSTDFSKMTASEVMAYSQRGPAELAAVQAWQKTAMRPPATS